MDYIRVVLQNLPVTIRGFTVYYFDEDGMTYYTIFINSRLSEVMQCATYDHEIKHINNNDFDSMLPADRLEAIRHVG